MDPQLQALVTQLRSSSDPQARMMLQMLLAQIGGAGVSCFPTSCMEFMCFVGVKGGFEFIKDSDSDEKAATRRDVFFKTDCDAGVKHIAKLVGWHDHLTELISKSKEGQANPTAPTSAESKADAMSTESASAAASTSASATSSASLSTSETVSSTSTESVSNATSSASSPAKL